MNIISLEKKLAEAQHEFLSYFDLETGEQLEDTSAIEEKIKDLEEKIRNKKREYALLIKDGYFKQLKEKYKAKIEEYKKVIDNITKREEFIENTLSYIAQEEGVIDIQDDNGEHLYYLLPKVKVKTEVKEEEVEDIYKKFTLKDLTYDEWVVINNLLDSTEELKEYKDKVTSRVLKTDLPETHKAIVKQYKDSIKIVKNLPKEVNND